MSIKATPMIFGGDMIRAMLSGRKTQTRRVLKPQPVPAPEQGRWEFDPPAWFRKQWDMSAHSIECDPYTSASVLNCCPYGRFGDLIYVQEGFAYLPASAYRASAGIEQRLSPGCPDMAAVFREGFDRSGQKKWRSSAQMPRWASRITLRITDVRVERVQDIQPSDIAAEGVVIPSHHRGELHSPYRWRQDHWRPLWDSIYAERGYGWDANPWVWCISFEPIQANVDDVLRGSA